jgi:hypothetical protein
MPDGTARTGGVRSGFTMEPGDEIKIDGQRYKVLEVLRGGSYLIAVKVGNKSEKDSLPYLLRRKPAS